MNMKFLKPFRLVLLFAVLPIFALAPRPAQAQKAGLYEVLTANSLAAGATNTWTIGSTTNLVINCSEFDNVGFALIESGPGTNSAQIVRFYKSFDGGNTFETSSSFSFTTPTKATTQTQFATGTNISTVGVTHLAIGSVENGTAGGTATNTLRFYLKSPKYGARQASQ
jgi:hypothetical protein